MEKAFEKKQFAAEMICIINSWIDTPYRHCTKVKGRGADCATFMVAIFEEIGVIDNFKVPYYSMDWHIHGKEDLFINNLEKFMVGINDPYSLEKINDLSPKNLSFGDWLVFAMSPLGYANHSAIYIDNGLMVHCIERVGVRMSQCLDFFPKLSMVYRLYKGA